MIFKKHVSNKKKRILLIQLDNSYEIFYPLGLSSLVPTLKKSKFIIKGFDFQFNKLKDLIKLLYNFRPYFIGISSNSYQINNVLKLCKLIKNIINPIIIIGGPHATLFPEDFIKNSFIDYVIRGDGEFILPLLLKKLLNNKKDPEINISSVCYKKRDNRIILNKINYNYDLNEYPYPDRELFPLEKYRHEWRNIGISTPIITSRGCKNNCSFCSTPRLSNNIYRYRSINHIINEIKYLIEKFKINRIMIEDDQFIHNFDHTKKLLLNIIRNNFNIDFEITNGVDPFLLNKELIELLSKAKFKSIALGIEHPDIKERKKLGRNITNNQLKKIIKILKDNKINITGYYIITSNDIKSFIKLLFHPIKLGLDMTHYSILQNVPGSNIKDMRFSIIKIIYKKLLYLLFYFRPIFLVKIFYKEGLINFIKGAKFFIIRKLIH